MCLIYLVRTTPAFGGSPANQWFHIAPASAGVFGVSAGFLAMWVVSWLTPPPDPKTSELVDTLRGP